MTVKAVYNPYSIKTVKLYHTQEPYRSENDSVTRVVGSKYDNLYYPAISGVARSINYYPIGNRKSKMIS